MNLTVFFRRWLANPAGHQAVTFCTTLQLLHHLAIAPALAARREAWAPLNFPPPACGATFRATSGLMVCRRAVLLAA